MIKAFVELYHSEAWVSWCASLILGALVTATYAWQRFNEPTFSHEETLPRTVEPLRYLFLGSTYPKARGYYIIILMLVWLLLAFIGPAVFTGFIGSPKAIPLEVMPLAMALVLIGAMPIKNLFWLRNLEELLRRLVHSWYFVPEGIKETIGSLVDADFRPVSRQLDTVQDTQRRAIQEGLELSRGSLRYRWARLTMLMELLSQMGPGGPLNEAAFRPFEKDLEGIRERYRTLERNMEPLGKGKPISKEREDALTAEVNQLLGRVYACISWGVRYKAKRDADVYRRLNDIGFSIRTPEPRNFFDIVFWPFVFVAGITLLNSLFVDLVVYVPKAPTAKIVMDAVLFAVAAGAMYGCAVWIALRGRSNQIDQREWRQGSPKGFVPIAVRAGLVTWAVIAVVTVLGQEPGAPQSQLALDVAKRFAPSDGAVLGAHPPWQTLAVQTAEFSAKVVTALPWVLAGMAVSVLVCHLLGGDVRRTGKRDRARDALILGVGLAAAAAMAVLIQEALKEQLGLNPPGEPISTAKLGEIVVSTGVAALLCGAAIGFSVPHAFKAGIRKPFTEAAHRALTDLLGRAETRFGTRAAAEDYVFRPLDAHKGISPAEAVQSTGHQNEATRMLEAVGPPTRREEDTRPDRSERPAPVVIEGGRGAG